MRSENSGGWGNAFTILLSAFVIVLIALALIPFIIGTYIYYQGKYIDYQLHLMKPEDALWLVILFGIPPALQITGLVVMFPRLHRDRSLTIPYGVCLFVMSCSPLSYCVLWILYMSGLHSWDGFSTWALVAIFILLIPVVLMTYAIMWTPGRLSAPDAPLLDEQDIKNKDWTAFCKELKKDGSGLCSFRRRILERLPIDLHRRITKAKAQDDYDNINKQKLLEGLNKVLELPDLYLAVSLDSNDIRHETRDLLYDGHKNLTGKELKKLHRLLLEDCFPDSVEKRSSDGHSEYGAKRKVPSGGGILADVKDGVKKAHFWMLANFFAVFLGVTYLFGFAFAFHDQKSIADGNGPALYMPRTLHSGAGVKQVNAPVAAQDGEPPAGRYTLYFDSVSAHPDLSAESVPADTPVAPGPDWKQKVNTKRVEAITGDIFRLTGRGERLRVELLGNTDCSNLQAGTAYSSNYELSEARAQNVKYVLLKRLAELGKAQGDTEGRRHVERQWGVEWAYLPVSSEGSPLSRLPKERGEEAKCGRATASGVSARQAGAAAVSIDSAALGGKLDVLKADLVKSYQLEGGDAQTLGVKLDKLKTLVGEKIQTQDELEEPIARVTSLAWAYSRLNKAKSRGGDKERQSADIAEAQRREVRMLEEEVKIKEAEVDDSLQASTMDKDGARRAVVVSVVPVQESRTFVPLTLMDYMYFTIYTITTTGYGDIIPSSPFAKFVCSVANILEVFFLVVFFNALLSVKGERRLSRAADRK